MKRAHYTSQMGYFGMLMDKRQPIHFKNVAEDEVQNSMYSFFTDGLVMHALILLAISHVTGTLGNRPIEMSRRNHRCPLLQFSVTVILVNFKEHLLS